MAQGSWWENVCAWRFFFFFFFFFFFAIWSRIISSFLSLFLSLFFCLFLRISYAGPFGPRLIGVVTGLRYKGTTVTIFFLLRKPFAPFFYLLESSCWYYYQPASAVLNDTRIERLLVLISPWGSFKKCSIATTHKYATAVERIKKARDKSADDR